MIAVIPAKAGIQKHERFFVTLHNTSWARDYCKDDGRLKDSGRWRAGP